MITFGLTGGIACGKSTVTKTFRKHGIPLVDADIVARQVVDVGTPGYFDLLQTFGEEFFLEDGRLDRSKLGELVFSDKVAMQKLTKCLKFRIDYEAGLQLSRWHHVMHEPIVGYDAALLCEQGDAKKYRPLIVVACPREVQLERLMRRNSLTNEQAEARINAQMSTEDKVKLADFVIDTSKEIEYSIKQTEDIIQQLKSK